MPDLSRLTALIIDANATMRTQLRNMLVDSGLERVDLAVSAGAAVRKLRDQQFDLILCEFHLGDGQDGQHLLEDLRNNHIIPLKTLFLMVTGERQYEKVVSAAELAPNDYVLKPFAADTLHRRIARAVLKRAVFLPIYRAIDANNTPAAIRLCRESERQHSQYEVDFMRLRAELHLASGEADEAEATYTQVLELRALPWARLGLAKALFLRQEYASAEKLLTSLVEENENFLDAYDWLARTREATGELEAARDTLARAIAVSPNRLSRLRHLGAVALEIGDVATAEKVMQDVVQMGKYSDFRDPEDHVRLLKAQLGGGKLEDAATTLRDLDKSMGGTEAGKLCKAISSVLLHDQLGDAEKARAALDTALAESKRLGKVSAEMKQTLAETCFDHDMEAAGTEVVLDILRTAETPRALAKTRQMLAARGHGALVQSLEKRVHDEVRTLVSAGARKAKDGDFDGAVAEMLNAARKMPNNAHVLFNAALALLRNIEHRGWNDSFATQARGLIERVRRQDPGNARLPALIDLMTKLHVKFGIGSVRV